MELKIVSLFFLKDSSAQDAVYQNKVWQTDFNTETWLFQYFILSNC